MYNDQDYPYDEKYNYYARSIDGLYGRHAE